MVISRLAEDALQRWLAARRRKPLVLRGARQVGKTTLVRRFAAARGMPLCEVNLERHLYLDRVFESLDTGRILRELEGLGGTRLDGALLFLDEVQATPRALPALRYLYEDRPDLPVVAAGSLLEFTLADHGFSMPVGRIQYLHLGPLTFREFLAAVDPAAGDPVAEASPDAPPTDAAHRRYGRRLREYLLVGGLPEAVLAYCESGSPMEVSAVHRSIASTYEDDFAKYARRTPLARLQRLFRLVPRSVGHPVTYRRLDPEARAAEVGRAIDLLVKARVCHRGAHSHCSGLPLGADAGNHASKLLFMDVGLMNHLCGLDLADIEALDDIRLVNEGGMAEQYVGQQLVSLSGGEQPPELHYWLRHARRGNAEIDYVIPHRDWIVPIEVKAGRSGSLKSLLQFVHEKHPLLAVRFDANPPSVQTVRHAIRTATGTQDVTACILSLPLYAVEALPRLLRAQRSALGPSTLLRADDLDGTEAPR
ncbi:MAG: AAA family ATPase [Acidobacteria bacterium]|nr:AAA family ATPase [Acidobacteriota bacterium]